jgi:WD40 repeat protein
VSEKAGEARYHAFLSYSHRADRFRAVGLQRALQGFAKPFYRWKALNVFRDETNLAANPALWPSIERALAASRTFILLACPEAAASAWCAREIEWWLAHRSPDTLLIVLTGGELVYDEASADFDWSRTTALPRVLAGRSPVEPLYRDLRWASEESEVSLNDDRFRAEILPLAAALHGKEPQELASDDLRAFRRARLAWRGAAAGLAVLTLTSLGAAWLADRKSRDAERERAIAVARQLAAEAETTRLARPALLPRSILLAVESARRLGELGTPSPQVNSTLREGLRLVPRRAKVFTHADVAAFALSKDGRRAVSVSLDGAIGAWDLQTGRELGRLITGTTALEAAVSPDAALVALAGEKEVEVWGFDERRVIARVRHERTITCLAFSADSRMLAVGSLDGVASVTTLADGRERARFAHRDTVEAVAFSADGMRLATGTGSVATRMLKRQPQDEAAHVWDLEKKVRVARLMHDHVVGAVAFSADGKRLATGSLDGIARVWDIDSARELARARHPDGVQRVAFSPNDRYVASGSQPFLIASKDQTVQIWEATTGREVGRIAHQNAILDLAFSPDGRWVATASADGTVRLIDFPDREAARIALDGRPTAVAFTQDSRQLAIGGPRLRLVRAEQGFSPLTVPLRAHIRRLAVAREGDRVAVVENENSLSVWQVGTAKALYAVAHDGIIVAAAFSPDGRTLATASDDRTARLWDGASGRLRARLQHDDKVIDLAFSPDGRTLATASSDKTARLWDVDAGTERSRLAHHEAVNAIRYSSDGRVLATGTTKGRVEAWEASSGKSLMTATLGVDLDHLAISPDGRRIAASGFDPIAVVWDARSGEVLARLKQPTNVSALAYAPDGRLIVATWDGPVRVWRGDGSRVEMEVQHESWVGAIAFSADGRYLATGSADRTARVWRLADMREVARLIQPVEVTAVAFASDHKHLIAASSDPLSPPHALSFWSWRLADLVDEACARVTRNLTLEEWRLHLQDEPYRRTCPNLPQHPSTLAPLLERARSAAADNQGAAAANSYAQLARAAIDTDDYDVANQICWTGSLDGAAREVLPLCERAVTLDSDAGYLKDSRGLARALTGDRAGAIADFTAFIAWANKATPDSPQIARREQWVSALRAGNDPFDAATLTALRTAK